jgi:5-methylcytosine-specific restriction endonuclease McrA
MYDDGTSNGVPYMKVLALSSNYEPLGVISWIRAVSLIYSNKVTTLEEYEHEIRSPSVSIKAPAVVLFKNGYVGKSHKNSIRFSRKNVWIRDEGRCQYCLKNVSLATFTIDHIVPKTSGGQTCWNNVVTCCYTCNQKKGNKSLKDSGFKLNIIPKKPNRLPFVQEIADGLYSKDKGIPAAWKFYLERY